MQILLSHPEKYSQARIGQGKTWVAAFSAFRRRENQLCRRRALPQPRALGRTLQVYSRRMWDGRIDHLKWIPHQTRL